MKLIFSNPGEIDIRLITTLGVNVKSGPSPIGQFGTGLKYAIAGVLRLGGTIEIRSGSVFHSFFTAPEEIRGKVFDFIHLDSYVQSDLRPSHQVLGYTTELGAAWKPWMIYREFLSNCFDEGGTVILADGLVQSSPPLPMTHIIVDCPALQAAHEARAEFWLEGEPLWANKEVGIYPGLSRGLYLRGIRAQVPGSDSAESYAYTYSLLGSHALTEDRTLASPYEARLAIARAILACPIESIPRTILAGGRERQLPWDQEGIVPGAVFRAEAFSRIASHQGVPHDVRTLLDRTFSEALAKADALQVPTTWVEMQEQAPIPHENTYISYYSIQMEMDDRVSSLEKQVAWWKACAEELARRQGEAGVVYDPTQDGSISDAIQEDYGADGSGDLEPLHADKIPF